MFKKLILAASISMALVACSFDKNNGNDNTPRARENEKKENDYSRVIGFYKGTLTTPSGTQSVSFSLYTLADNGGADISLNSNYKRLDPIGKDFNFKVDYIPETGSLTFSNVNLEGNPNSGKVEADDIHTISAKVSGKNIVGEVKSRSGTLGILNATLSTQENNKPGDKQEQEYYDRLGQEYEKITGIYEGKSINDEKQASDILVDIRVRRLSSGSLTVPQIWGVFNWKSRGNDGTALTLTVDFKYDLNPPRLVMEGTPRDFQGRPYKAVFDAVIINNTIMGSWSSTRGFEGNYELKLVKKHGNDSGPKPTPPANGGGDNSSPVYIVCVAGDSLKVRDESLQKTLFSAKRGEKVIPSTAASDAKKAVIGGTQYTFVKSQFPERKGAIGWVAQEFLRLEGQCPK